MRASGGAPNTSSCITRLAGEIFDPSLLLPQGDPGPGGEPGPRGPTGEAGREVQYHAIMSEQMLQLPPLLPTS